jgi:hypothetical protein
VRAAGLALGLLAAPAFADTPPPDARAVQAGEDANLVSDAPRAGVTFSAALGGALVLGGNGNNIGDTGVGRGVALSFRVGHVATRDTVITLEFTGGSRFHEASVSGSPLYHDDDFNLLAGALVYITPSVWLRGSAGLSVISFDDSAGIMPRAGVAGLGGIGIDIVRWRKLVLGIEGWGMTSIVAVRGVVFESALALGLSYY